MAERYSAPIHISVQTVGMLKNQLMRRLQPQIMQRWEEWMEPRNRMGQTTDMDWRRVKILIRKAGRMPTWVTGIIIGNFMEIRQKPEHPIMDPHPKA